MRYQQLKDILLHLHQAHQQLGERYHQWQRQQPAERSRLLLEFMIQKEKEAARHAGRLQQSLDAKLQETWVDIQTDGQFAQALTSLPQQVPDSTESILEQAVALDEALIAELEVMARHLDGEGLQSWCAGIVQEERTRQHQLVHNAHRLEDI
ncbi:hypothetical protein [Pseudaeromonas paramecii]|uniref:Uncharacterized protein n=1 Tax=Pseudaeromonas paramecii TaxID=2138166 RepID=A0ABP8QCD9_9GAMM